MEEVRSRLESVGEGQAELLQTTSLYLFFGNIIDENRLLQLRYGISKFILEVLGSQGKGCRLLYYRKFTSENHNPLYLLCEETVSTLFIFPLSRYPSSRLYMKDLTFMIDAFDDIPRANSKYRRNKEYKNWPRGELSVNQYAHTESGT